MFSEPNAAPKITKAYALGPYSAKVQWTVIEEIFWRASNIAYKVIYRKKNTNEESNNTVLDQKGENELHDLEPNTTYVVQVLATNSKGDGDRSTEQDFNTKSRKFLKLLFGIYIRFVR